jgi:hypothetical protein
MRTLRLSLAGTAILALLGGFGGAVVAQDEAEELSGVTVTVTQQCTDVGHAGCDWTASDPRLPDTLEYEWTGNVEDAAAGDAGLDAGLTWGDVGFEGPDGGWTGHSYVLWGDPTHNFLVLSGTGANEGWQYIASGIATDSFGDFEWVGTLYEGELPPFPEPAE